MNKNKLAFFVSVSLPALMYGMTPNEALMNAVIEENIEQATAALNAGADVNYTTPCWGTNETALHYAATRCNANMVKLLLEKHANANAKDCTGNTPLHAIAINVSSSKRPTNYTEIVDLLLAAGADINALNNEGQTPLFRTVYNTRRADMAKLFLENGAHRDLQYSNSDGKQYTVLDLARLSKNQEMIKLLNEVPLLKNLTARVIKRLIQDKQLDLKQVKSIIPADLHAIVEPHNSNFN